MPENKTSGTERTLVIIDMQPQGWMHSRWILKQVLREVQSAMDRGDGIVVVEFDLDCAGATADEITSVLANYDRAVVTRKRQEDGSAEVIEACRDAGLNLSSLRLCGVMTDVCVRATASGLAAKLPDAQIEVVKDACNTWNSRYDWTTFADAPNIYTF